MRYRQARRLTETAIRDPLFNPGAAWVSNLSAEPVIFREVLDDLVRPAQAQGLLRCLMRHRPMEAVMEGDQVEAVTFEDLQTGENRDDHRPLRPRRHGGRRLAAIDRLRVRRGCGVRRITGEPHALDGPADPLDQQAITWCAALEWRPGEDHTIDRPEAYEFWRSYRADFWPGPQLGWATPEPETGRPLGPRCSNPVSRTCGRSAGFGMAAITSMRCQM